MPIHIIGNNNPPMGIPYRRSRFSYGEWYSISDNDNSIICYISMSPLHKERGHRRNASH